MPKPNAFVAQNVRLEPGFEGDPYKFLQAEGGGWVRLDRERRAWLDPEDGRSAGYVRVLAGLERERFPAYVEIDPATSAVRRILIPLITRVGPVRPTDDGHEVDLGSSHARHIIASDEPDSEEIRRALVEARDGNAIVLVTEDDDHHILDVRAYMPDPEAPLPPFPEPLPRPLLLPRPFLWRLLIAIWWWPWWPWWWFRWWFRCNSAARAQQIFDAMAAMSCDPLTVPAPCIPFLYPDDGCWARAHEMCRLMINMAVSPAKVWIRASTRLHVNTRNHPGCFVEWGWHVAPTVCVRRSFPYSDRMVIDPSLFSTPVTEATWKGAQSDPGASLTDTSWTQYWPQSGTTDPSFTDTNSRLAYYRLRLLNRAIQFGPPPYAHCP